MTSTKSPASPAAAMARLRIRTGLLDASRWSLALVWMVLLCSVSAAQTSGTMLSGVTWEQAEPDLRAMKEAELRALLNYLSECNDRDTLNPTIANSCRIARVKYQTEYKQSRPVDAVIDDIEKIYEVRRALRAAGIPHPKGVNHPEPL